MENDVKGGQAVPKCPWCGAPMADDLRQTSEGWVAYCHCVICKARAPAVVSKTLDEHLIPAARMIVNCRFLRTGNQTNGDKLREFANMPDDVLAQRLLEIDDIAEEIPFCKELPECQELAEGIEPIPADKCLQCLINWLGQPAEEEV